MELLAYSLGLGGFYSLFILKADEIDHDKLMEFFQSVIVSSATESLVISMADMDANNYVRLFSDI